MKLFVEHAPEFMTDEYVGRSIIGKVALRSYTTNADLDSTLTKAFCKKYQVRETEKGRTNFRVPAFKNSLQLTTKGIIMIFGGQGIDDEKIMTALRADVRTRGGEPFSWSLRKKVTGAIEAKAQMMRIANLLMDESVKDYVTNYQMSTINETYRRLRELNSDLKLEELTVADYRKMIEKDT